MSELVLIIGGVDYAEKCLELPSANDLDADGSGRDTQTGEMFRTKIAEKLKFEVSMDRLYEGEMAALAAALKQPFYDATVINPETNAAVTKRFYTAARPFGVQRYSKSERLRYYDGVTFDMTEK